MSRNCQEKRKGGMVLENEVVYNVYVQSTTSPHATEKKIQRFKKLEAGWHYGEGVPFSQPILDRAIRFHQTVVNLGFFETNAFPGPNGEVVVTIYTDDHYLEFIFEPDDSITFCHEVGDEETCYEEGLSLQETVAKLQEFRKETWTRSVSSTVSSMIANVAARGVGRSAGGET